MHVMRRPSQPHRGCVGSARWTIWPSWIGAHSLLHSARPSLRAHPATNSTRSCARCRPNRRLWPPSRRPSRLRLQRLPHDPPRELVKMPFRRCFLRLGHRVLRNQLRPRRWRVRALVEVRQRPRPPRPRTSGVGTRLNPRPRPSHRPLYKKHRRNRQCPSLRAQVVRLRVTIPTCWA